MVTPELQLPLQNQFSILFFEATPNTGYYNKLTESDPGIVGITTITFNEFIPYPVFPDDPFTLQRISRILTSSHSFEYVGTGTDINRSTPLVGGVTIKENEVVASGGSTNSFYIYRSKR